MRTQWLMASVVALAGCSAVTDFSRFKEADGEVVADAGRDAASGTDAGAGDGGSNDGAMDAATGDDAGMDAGNDAGSTQDAGMDAGDDAGSTQDAGMDAGDAGSGDAGTDSGTTDAGCPSDERQYWPDMDEDTYGDEDATGTFMCPDTLTGNWATNNDDCDDTTDQIHPDENERCNAKDDDCDGTTDTDNPSYECISGSTETCTGSSNGCTYTGSRDCDVDSCTWSACMPPAESCNDADDDCDGFVDEGLYEELGERSVSGSYTNPTGAPAVAYDPTNEQLGVAFTAEDSDGNEQVWLALLNPSSGSGLSVEAVQAVTEAPGSKRNVDIRYAAEPGAWIVTFFDASNTHVMWSYVSSSFDSNFQRIEETLVSQSYAYGLATADGLPAIIYSGGAQVILARIDAGGGVDRNVINNATQLATVQELELTFDGNEFNMAVTETDASSSQTAVVVYDVSTSAVVQERSENLVPTDWRYWPRGTRGSPSAWLNILRDADASRQRRFVLFYVTRDTGGGTEYGSFWVSTDGNLNFLQSTQFTTSAGGRLGMGHSPVTRSLGLSSGTNFLRKSYDGTSFGNTLSPFPGSYNDLWGGEIGPRRFIRAAPNFDSGEVEVHGIGCTP